MKKLLSTLIVLFTFTSIYGQNTKIEVQIFLKGELVNLKRGIKVSLINKNDTLRLQSSGNSFYLPDSLNMKKKNFLVQGGGYMFYFCETYMAYQPLLPKWSISLDNKPFLEENKYLLKNCDKKVRSLYSLDINRGNLITVYSKKKMKPSH
ncbi:MAG: hypothetical protein ACRCVT_02550 [Leadbetterella sp.]